VAQQKPRHSASRKRSVVRPRGPQESWCSGQLGTTGFIRGVYEGEFTARVLKQNIDVQGLPAETAQPSNDPWGNLVRTAFAKSNGKDISIEDMMAGLDPKLQKIMTPHQPKPEDPQPFRSPHTG